jgi:uncharacterized protein YbcI
MRGFAFRYRRGGGQATVQSFAVARTETITLGDIVNVDSATVSFAISGDTALLGVALQTIDGTAGTGSIQVITDADAVYAVDDAHARRKGDTLNLTGTTGLQGVTTSPASDLVVEADSTATDETLVSIKIDVRFRTRSASGDLNAAIVRSVAAYYREHTGRGPNRAQAFHTGDVVTVVLEDTMTKAERSLVERGRPDAVMRLREAFQETMRGGLVATVEALTDRSVRALVSGSELDPDVAVAVFLLDRPIAGG